MEKLIVMIIFGIFWAIWKVIENANVPQNKAPPVNRPQRETSRQKLQNELDKFLREVNNSGEPQNKPPERNTAYDQVEVVQEKSNKDRDEVYYQAKRNKKNKNKPAPKQPVATSSQKQQPARKSVPLSEKHLSTVESHVSQYMGQKLDSNVTETTSAHLKPFENHISTQTPQNLESTYDKYGSPTSNPPPPQLPMIKPAQIIKLMQDQNSVRNAFILSEILKKPDLSRFKVNPENNSADKS